MSAITSSFEFHKELESPAAFVRREWQALVLFGGGFVLVLVIGIFAVREAYFYPRLETDPLLYWLKGLAFVETGHTAARVAINRAPFHYVAMPGVLRAPMIMAFRDFDNQLRAIQLANIFLVGATATMYAYILSWVIPKKWHWLAIGFSFAFVLLSPEWVANVFEPLADAPYAFFTIVVMLIAARILTSNHAIGAWWPWLLTAVVCFIIAFLTRFTAPVLFVYAGLLVAGRSRHHPVSLKLSVMMAVAATALLVALAALNWETISRRYIIEPYGFLARAPKPGMLMNLFALSWPSQIIPDFRLGFSEPPVKSVYHVQFGNSPRDFILISVGFFVSAMIALGMWRTRRRLAPEIVYVLAVLPVIGAMIPSTARYLMAYQPFFWVFFLVGASEIFSPIASRLAASPRASLVSMLLIIAAALGLISLRASKVVGTHGGDAAAISIGESRAYFGEVAGTFGALRNFLDKLPRDRTLLIGWPGFVGRWKAISGLDYYRPDSALSAIVKTRDTYVLAECATYEVCEGFDVWDARFREGFDKFGAFTFEPVFSRVTDHAKAKVYRVRNRQ